MNMPGSYLIELAAMHVFGAGELGWRLFDFSLLLAATAAFVTVSRRRHWLAPVLSATLFILIHGRDGLAQGGQRDFTMAVCLIAATAFLFLAVRRHSNWCAAAFGVLSGVALTIKPTAILLSVAQVSLAWHALRRSPRSSETPDTRLVTSAVLGSVAGPGIALAFLLRERALSAFLDGLSTVVPYYASLGHRPLSFVLTHSLSPLEPLIFTWLLLLALRATQTAWIQDWERNALIAGALFGVLNCVLQQRALPYYRYPLLAFLLPLMAIDFTTVTPRSAAPAWKRRTAHTLSAAAIAFSAFFLAPRSTILIHRYQWRQLDFISSLQQELDQLGGAALSGRIQCIDSISGCGNVLYRMRLEPATGVLSDFLLFGNPSDRRPPEDIPVIRETRASFSAAVLARPPQVIVVSSHLHIEAGENFSKLARWPEFDHFLASRYMLRTEWHPSRTTLWWSRPETPASYRVYVLRAAAPPPL